MRQGKVELQIKKAKRYRVYHKKAGAWFYGTAMLEDGSIFNATSLNSEGTISKRKLDPKVFIVQWNIGKHDRNGNAIFDGDWLKWIAPSDQEEDTLDLWLVKWEAPAFVFECHRDGKVLEKGHLLKDTSEFEIVGNVFDPPRLNV